MQKKEEWWLENVDASLNSNSIPETKLTSKEEGPLHPQPLLLSSDLPLGKWPAMRTPVLAAHMGLGVTSVTEVKDRRPHGSESCPDSVHKQGRTRSPVLSRAVLGVRGRRAG